MPLCVDAPARTARPPAVAQIEVDARRIEQIGRQQLRAERGERRHDRKCGGRGLRRRDIGRSARRGEALPRRVWPRRSPPRPRRAQWRVQKILPSWCPDEFDLPADGQLGLRPYRYAVRHEFYPADQVQLDNVRNLRSTSRRGVLQHTAMFCTRMTPSMATPHSAGVPLNTAGVRSRVTSATTAPWDKHARLSSFSSGGHSPGCIAAARHTTSSTAGGGAGVGSGTVCERVALPFILQTRVLCVRQWTTNRKRSNSRGEDDTRVLPRLRWKPSAAERRIVQEDDREVMICRRCAYAMHGRAELGPDVLEDGERLRRSQRDNHYEWAKKTHRRPDGWSGENRERSVRCMQRAVYAVTRDNMPVELPLNALRLCRAHSTQSPTRGEAVGPYECYQQRLRPF
jgi:hypothetical protein